MALPWLLSHVALEILMGGVRAHQAEQPLNSFLGNICTSGLRDGCPLKSNSIVNFPDIHQGFYLLPLNLKWVSKTSTVDRSNPEMAVAVPRVS